MSTLEIRDVGYDHPDAGLLVEQVQAEYVRRYGGRDEAPIEPDQFSRQQGLFAVGYLGARPVVMGGWRLHQPDHPQTGWASPAAELKRMYVDTEQRGRGFARSMLGYLERSAHQHGVRWLLLETGSKQPEAIALYRSTGYVQVPPFGHYADMEHSLHLGKELAGQAGEQAG
ncbi:MAG: GNAT family N-acetyltransferase [Jatrophihabitans sp.]